MSQPAISVVIPCYNEQEVLPEFHARITAAMEGIGLPFELVYVNDGSRDGTLALMLQAQAADARVAQAGAAAGLAFRHDLMQRTPNTIDAHRVIRMAGEAGCQDAVVERLFRGYFQEGQDVGAPATLAALAGEAGLDAAAVAAMLASPAHAAEVTEEDAGFRRLGLDGVPTFALDGHVVFSGAMPAEQMAEAFRRALTILRQRAAAE